MKKQRDPDITEMTAGQLRREVARLRHAIRKHRDADENARCWHNDLALYGLLPENEAPGRMCGDEQVLLRNCKRYIRRQQCERHDCGRKAPRRTRSRSR